MTNDKLAVLIDADNAQPSTIKALLAEVSRYGTATIKRIYGDWTSDRLKGWKSVLNIYAVQPIQQFAYTHGKNATDAALIIDAMDLLHSGQVNGFCLVSSDSDFTRLATRIREAGLEVYGFGERKTPAPFVAACDKFIYTEILRDTETQNDEKTSPLPSDTTSAPSSVPPNDGATIPPLKPILSSAVMAAALDDGWAHLGQIGHLLVKNHSAFDPRNYGFQKLGELVRNQPYLEVKEVQPNAKNATAQLYIRLKQLPLPARTSTARPQAQAKRTKR
jgi:hypothetical protein